jgi:hypothetical protein
VFVSCHCSGAKDTWKTGSVSSTFSGVPTMETKLISFSGGGGSGGAGRISMSGQHFASPVSSNMVSMKGGGGGSAVNMVSFKGGGEIQTLSASSSEQEKMPVPVEEFQQQCRVDAATTAADDDGKDNSHTQESSDEASFSYSNDGAMLFSMS